MGFWDDVKDKGQKAFDALKDPVQLATDVAKSAEEKAAEVSKIAREKAQEVLEKVNTQVDRAAGAIASGTAAFVSVVKTSAGMAGGKKEPGQEEGRAQEAPAAPAAPPPNPSVDPASYEKNQDIIRKYQMVLLSLAIQEKLGPSFQSEIARLKTAIQSGTATQDEIGRMKAIEKGMDALKKLAGLTYYTDFGGIAAQPVLATQTRDDLLNAIAGGDAKAIERTSSQVTSLERLSKRTALRASNIQTILSLVPPDLRRHIEKTGDLSSIRAFYAGNQNKGAPAYFEAKDLRASDWARRMEDLARTNPEKYAAVSRYIETEISHGGFETAPDLQTIPSGKDPTGPEANEQTINKLIDSAKSGQAAKPGDYIRLPASSELPTPEVVPPPLVGSFEELNRALDQAEESHAGVGDYFKNLNAEFANKASASQRAIAESQKSLGQIAEVLTFLETPGGTAEGFEDSKNKLSAAASVLQSKIMGLEIGGFSPEARGLMASISAEMTSLSDPNLSPEQLSMIAKKIASIQVQVLQKEAMRGSVPLADQSYSTESSKDLHDVLSNLHTAQSTLQQKARQDFVDGIRHQIANIKRMKSGFESGGVNATIHRATGYDPKLSGHYDFVRNKYEEALKYAEQGKYEEASIKLSEASVFNSKLQAQHTDFESTRAKIDTAGQVLITVGSIAAGAFTGGALTAAITAARGATIAAASTRMVLGIRAAQAIVSGTVRFGATAGGETLFFGKPPAYWEKKPEEMAKAIGFELGKGIAIDFLMPGVASGTEKMFNHFAVRPEVLGRLAEMGVKITSKSGHRLFAELMAAASKSPEIGKLVGIELSKFATEFSLMQAIDLPMDFAAHANKDLPFTSQMKDFLGKVEFSEKAGFLVLYKLGFGLGGKALKLVSKQPLTEAQQNQAQRFQNAQQKFHSSLKEFDGTPEGKRVIEDRFHDLMGIANEDRSVIPARILRQLDTSKAQIDSTAQKMGSGAIVPAPVNGPGIEFRAPPKPGGVDQVVYGEPHQTGTRATLLPPEVSTPPYGGGVSKSGGLYRVTDMGPGGENIPVSKGVIQTKVVDAKQIPGTDRYTVTFRRKEGGTISLEMTAQDMQNKGVATHVGADGQLEVTPGRAYNLNRPIAPETPVPVAVPRPGNPLVQQAAEPDGKWTTTKPVEPVIHDQIPPVPRPRAQNPSDRAYIDSMVGAVARGEGKIEGNQFTTKDGDSWNLSHVEINLVLRRAHALKNVIPFRPAAGDSAQPTPTQASSVPRPRTQNPYDKAYHDSMATAIAQGEGWIEGHQFITKDGVSWDLTPVEKLIVTQSAQRIIHARTFVPRKSSEQPKQQPLSGAREPEPFSRPAPQPPSRTPSQMFPHPPRLPQAPRSPYVAGLDPLGSEGAPISVQGGKPSNKPDRPDTRTPRVPSRSPARSPIGANDADQGVPIAARFPTAQADTRGGGAGRFATMIPPAMPKQDDAGQRGSNKQAGTGESHQPVKGTPVTRHTAKTMPVKPQDPVHNKNTVPAPPDTIPPKADRPRFVHAATQPPPPRDTARPPAAPSPPVVAGSAGTSGPSVTRHDDGRIEVRSGSGVTMHLKKPERPGGVAIDAQCKVNVVAVSDDGQQITYSITPSNGDPVQISLPRADAQAAGLPLQRKAIPPIFEFVSAPVPKAPATERSPGAGGAPARPKTVDVKVASPSPNDQRPDTVPPPPPSSRRDSTPPPPPQKFTGNDRKTDISGLNQAPAPQASPPSARPQANTVRVPPPPSVHGRQTIPAPGTQHSPTVAGQQPKSGLAPNVTVEPARNPPPKSPEQVASNPKETGAPSTPPPQGAGARPTPPSNPGTADSGAPVPSSSVPSSQPWVVLKAGASAGDIYPPRVAYDEPPYRLHPAAGTRTPWENVPIAVERVTTKGVDSVDVEISIPVSTYYDTSSFPIGRYSWGQRGEEPIYEVAKFSMSLREASRLGLVGADGRPVSRPPTLYLKQSASTGSSIPPPAPSREFKGDDRPTLISGLNPTQGPATAHNATTVPAPPHDPGVHTRPTVPAPATRPPTSGGTPGGPTNQGIPLAARRQSVERPTPTLSQGLPSNDGNTVPDLFTRYAQLNQGSPLLPRLIEGINRVPEAQAGRILNLAVAHRTPPNILGRLLQGTPDQAVRILTCALAQRSHPQTPVLREPSTGRFWRIEPTGEILGLGAGKTVFAGRVVEVTEDGRTLVGGETRNVAISMGTQAGLQINFEMPAMKAFQAMGIGDVRFYGLAKINGILGDPVTVMVTNRAEGNLVTNFPRDVPVSTQPEAAKIIARDIARLTREGWDMSGDIQFILGYDAKGQPKIQWIDFEGIPKWQPLEGDAWAAAYRKSMTNFLIPLGSEGFPSRNPKDSI